MPFQNSVWLMLQVSSFFCVYYQLFGKLLPGFLSLEEDSSAPLSLALVTFAETLEEEFAFYF